MDYDTPKMSFIQEKSLKKQMENIMQFIITLKDGTYVNMMSLEREPL